MPDGQTIVPDSWDPRRAAGGAVLHLVPRRGPGAGRCCAWTPTPTEAGVGLTLGRQEACELVLAGSERVSRPARPLRARRRPRRLGGWPTPQHLGTFVNGRRLDPAAPPLPLAEGGPGPRLAVDVPGQRHARAAGAAGRTRAGPAGAAAFTAWATRTLPPLQQGRLALLMRSAAELQEGGRRAGPGRPPAPHGAGRDPHGPGGGPEARQQRRPVRRPGQPIPGRRRRRRLGRGGRNVQLQPDRGRPPPGRWPRSAPTPAATTRTPATTRSPPARASCRCRSRERCASR